MLKVKRFSTFSYTIGPATEGVTLSRELLTEYLGRRIAEALTQMCLFLFGLALHALQMPAERGGAKAACILNHPGLTGL